LTSIKNSIAAETIIQNFKNCYQNSEQLQNGGMAIYFFTTGLFRHPANCSPATCGIAMTNKKYLLEHFSSIEYFFQFLQIAVYKLSVVIIKNS